MRCLCTLEAPESKKDGWNQWSSNTEGTEMPIRIKMTRESLDPLFEPEE